MRSWIEKMNNEQTMRDWIADIGTGVVGTAIGAFIFDSAISIARDSANSMKANSFIGMNVNSIYAGIIIGTVFGGAVGGVIIDYSNKSKAEAEAEAKVFSSLLIGSGVIASSVCTAILAASSPIYDDTALVSGAVFGCGVIVASACFGNYALNAIHDFFIAGQRFFDNSYFSDYVIDRASNFIDYITEDII